MNLQKEMKQLKKGIIIRDIKILFEQQEEHYKKITEVIFGMTIILNMKVKVIEIKAYQLKSTLMKLNRT